MKVGVEYLLQISLDEFVDNTQKREFAMHLRNNNFHCSPVRVEDGAKQKIAYFVFEGSVYEYELAEDYWHYFSEVTSFSSKPIQVKDYASSSAKVNTAVSTVAFKQDYLLENLSIQSGYGRALKKINIDADPILQSKDLLKFILDFILCENSRFDVSEILGMNAENKEAELWELYKAYYGKLAIDNVSRLVQEENERLGAVLDSFGYEL